MTMTPALDYYGRRMGLAHDSGWSNLSSGNGESHLAVPTPGSAPMYGMETIANATADEMFGGRRGRPVRRAVRATRPRRVARRQRRRERRQEREYERAGWGSPGWQAAQEGEGYMAAGYDTGAELLEPYDEDGAGTDMLDAEIEALLAEPEEGEYDEYGLFDEYYGEEDEDEDDEFGLHPFDEFGLDDDEEDEYGRRGRGRRGRRGRKKAFKAGMKIGRRRRRRRRRKRREEEEEEAPSYERIPMLPTALGQQIPMQREFPVAYGAAGVAPPPSQGTFGESFKTGLGVGLGFMGVVVGVSLLARGMR